MSLNVYQIITDRIVAMLEAGTVPWQKPWKTDAAGSVLYPKNLHSGKEYRGCNAFLLGNVGYASPYFLTFKQALARGGAVRKGEKGLPVIFWKVSDRASKGDDGETVNGKSFLLRYYTVFNVAQCDGIDAPAAPVIADAPKRPAFLVNEACERIVSGYAKAPAVRHGEARAYYAPRPDFINMPERGLFVTADAYYATLFHELSHSTGHETRLNRKTLADAGRFGDANYSKEELVAEMSASFLCAVAGIATDANLTNSAAYLKGWLSALKRDPKMLVQAAAQAQKAADYIQGRKPDAPAAEIEAPALTVTEGA